MAIVWDECTMSHKRSLEALDRTLKDLRDNRYIFGVTMILLSGYFCETLPVIPRSTVAEGRNLCLKSSAIGNNKVAMDTSTGFITLPTDFCHITDLKEKLIQRVFSDIAQKDLNTTIQNFLPGQLVSFKSVDTVMNQDGVVNYPTEFLNSLEVPGLPLHNLQLKVGSVVIMLRNINQPRLCNGTRLAVKS
ncbi:uncharacterized protein LOC129953570 [Eupeodes corollae]|uniref:uncharacterized protein LOC129953570 n=1 Tax=Eupeodes corollae TaxID=290404 RepID=UPI002490FC7F|nr:uncharacterized protein LOC129953570 [Eupeodes corollae]